MYDSGGLVYSLIAMYQKPTLKQMMRSANPILAALFHFLGVLRSCGGIIAVDLPTIIGTTRRRLRDSPEKSRRN